MAANKTILLTGASGMIGFRVLIDLLNNPLYETYTIRCAVRNPTTFSDLLALPAVAPKAHRVETVAVPDISAPDAYKEAIMGAQYAIHVASPLANAAVDGQDYEELLIKPSVNGTLRMLEAAASEASTVERVVITGSIASLGSIPGDVVANESSRGDTPSPPYSGAFEAYSVSKIRSLQASEEFQQRNPATKFDLVTILPTFVIGPDHLVTSPAQIAKGTNGLVMGPLLGYPLPNVLPFATVHVNDVSTAHIRSLDKKTVPAGNYIVSAPIGDLEWASSYDIVRKRYAKEVEQGLLKLDEKVKPGSIERKVDSSKAQKVLGIDFVGYEQQVVDVVEYFLGLVKGAQ